MNSDGKNRTSSQPDAKKKIYSFEKEGFVLTISEDSLTATIDFITPQNETELISSKIILDELSKLEIKTELNEELIKNSVSEFNNTKKNITNVVIAKGKEPKDGTDGWFEITANNNSENQSFNKEKNKSYKIINPVITVKQDDLIAVIHTPEQGKNGVDVFGKIIPAAEGKNVPVKLGENVFVKDDDVTKIYSKVDGFIEYKNNMFSVKDVLTIYGDIDYHSGNIFGYGSLKVLGNVLNGFYLSLKNSIEIGGYIGDAILEAGNHIKAQGGFLGVGSGVIKAGGDVELKFIQEQKVYSRGSLTFVREIVQSKIYVKDKIIGKGNHASIIGGYAIAGNSIEIYSAGNEYGTNTIIEVGYDYELKETLIKNRVKLNELKKNLKKIDSEIIEFAHMKRLNESMYNKMKELADKHKQVLEEIKLLNEENKRLIQTVRKPSNAFIKINSIVYSGTKIIINRKNLLIKENLTAKTFVLSEDNEIIAK